MQNRSYLILGIGRRISGMALFIGVCVTVLVISNSEANAQTFEFRGRIIDDETGKPIAGRVYLENEQGVSFHVKSASPKGNVVPYRVDRGQSREVHTSVSAHPFRVALAAGKYRLTVEHGKEFLPLTREFTIRDQPMQLELKIKRWSEVAEKGWYSGEIHIHRPVSEMPTVMLAEDLNVTLPLTYWVTDTQHTPQTDNKVPNVRPSAKSEQAELIKVTDQHVIWPLNTEYEIFSVSNKRHTLGAFFILNHKKPFRSTTPPVVPIAKEARRQGALIDIDKHNWPWSMMIVPQMNVDLFELSNNHVWRTRFLFSDWYKEYTAPFMNLKMNQQGGFTEESWLRFGFANYYALLNCGLKIMPSAGTATGVHPVPAGYGRVYVHLPDGFDYDSWMRGLQQGNSFVTNGPMLLARVDGKTPGSKFDFKDEWNGMLELEIGVPDPLPIETELIFNGVQLDVKPKIMRKSDGGTRWIKHSAKIDVQQSGWLIVRCIQRQKDGKIKFAHTAPFFFNKSGEPIRARRVEVEYLLKRVRDEIKRNQNVLSDEQMAEYQNALEFYNQKLKTAR